MTTVRLGCKFVLGVTGAGVPVVEKSLKGRFSLWGDEGTARGRAYQSTQTATSAPAIAVLVLPDGKSPASHASGGRVDRFAEGAEL